MTAIKPTPPVLDPCYLNLEVLIFCLDRKISENNTWQKVQMPVPPTIPVTGTSSKGRCLQVNDFFKESVPVPVIGTLWKVPMPVTRTFSRVRVRVLGQVKIYVSVGDYVPPQKCMWRCRCQFDSKCVPGNR